MEAKYGIGDILQVFLVSGLHHVLIEEIKVQSICVDVDYYTEFQYYNYTILETGLRGMFDTHCIDGDPLTRLVA